MFGNIGILFSLTTTLRSITNIKLVKLGGKKQEISWKQTVTV